MKKHLLFLFAALLPLVASAQTKVEIDGIWYNLESEAKQAEVTYKGDDPFQSMWYSGSITIPATVKYDGVKYSVTSIGYGAFYDCESLTAITLPEGVTSIGNSAFYSCSSLTSITLPEGVTSIGNAAFCDCSRLTAITIPTSVTSIESVAFSNCTSLTAITIPEGVTSIEGYTFSGCTSLTAITLPEGVACIGDDAFYGCSSLTAITIPESVTSIGRDAFRGCSSLTAIVVAKGNKVYDSRGDCNAIIETNSNTLIQGCTTTIIPESVTNIGDYAFAYCSSLTSITIPEGVTSIGSSAFSSCSSLTAITIPESVTNIGIGAFAYCRSLTAIVVAKGNKVYDSRGDCNAIIETNSNTLIQGCATTIIPESVTSIGSSAFSNCSSLTAITIPESVTNIGDWAFYGCSGLTAITIPEGVTSIGDGTFQGCSSLTTITLPEGVTSIGFGAFASCIRLTTITLPEGVTSIGIGAFFECTSLTDVYCHAATVPSTNTDAFDYSNIENATLHVPAGAIESYKATAPWSSFGTIVCLTDEDTSIEQLTNDNSQQTIYDLRGRRVDNPVKGGIYIVGGKKMMVK